MLGCSLRFRNHSRCHPKDTGSIKDDILLDEYTPLKKIIQNYLKSCFSRSSIDLNADCNKFCQCSTRYYKPVCSVADQQTYYSPCHAGCSNENSYYLDEVKVYIYYIPKALCSVKI